MHSKFARKSKYYKKYFLQKPQFLGIKIRRISCRFQIVDMVLQKMPFTKVFCFYLFADFKFLATQSYRTCAGGKDNDSFYECNGPC
jgi:hypothetical protein